ncbi:protein-glutamate methylesterase [Deinococcus malanensis]|uniref:protein-glutamate methylesterase n=1 Tax=Deinococcus malanensis TaxID=1706855 RepID=A0ABQ2F2D6_9DEIO|nr:chemotaxis protein CheB [Deinococcus malanensis]GGK33359.1 protein-glutamate methylesterase [Deinococcus malanensis]
MTDFPIVVIGASSGGVTALMKLCAGLPSDFPAAVLVVQHLSPRHPSMLPRILSSAGPLHALHPRSGQSFHRGMIYVAPPDHHMLVEGNTLLLTKGPKENRSRPSIDTLFRSAALTAGPNVIGVVLTGLLDDGTSGLHAVKCRGGVTIVQDPDTAEFDSMPRSALSSVEVDHVVPLAELATLLTTLVQDMTRTQPVGRPRMTEQEQHRLKVEVGIAREENAFRQGVSGLGTPSLLTCPECHGALIQIEEGKVARYRCHTGHAYTADALLSEVSESIEDKAYQVLRTLEEAVILLTHLSDQSTAQGDTQAAAAFLARAREIESSSEGVRRLALNNQHLSVENIQYPASED